jgi:uncharacterized ion transporter superfamily protein YfcC
MMHTPAQSELNAPRRTPDTLLILAAVILLVALIAALVPPGKFTQVQTGVGGSKSVQIELSSYQQTGPAQAIPLFAEGGGLGLLNLPFEGMVAGNKFGTAVGLIAFLLIMGGSFGVLMRTGAVDRAILGFVGRFQHQIWVLLPGLFILFSIGGAVFGMGEETIPFVLLLVPIFARLGLDAVCVVLVTYVATQIGFATSWMNPFSVIVAQSIAGLPSGSGAVFRVVMWASFTLVGIVIALRYAMRTRQPVTASTEHSEMDKPFWADWAILAVLVSTLIWVVYGVTQRSYYLPELAAQFFAMALVAGVIAWIGNRRAVSANALAQAFSQGAASMLPVALVVALAKGMLLLLGGTEPTAPSAMNTILFQLGHWLDGTPTALAAWLMLCVQSGINFLVPSGSGQAALTMPIMAPLGDLLGVTRQVSVLAFQLGDGLMNLIVPTSAMLMGVLGAARIDWLVWARLALGWMAILMSLASIFVLVAVWIGFA